MSNFEDGQLQGLFQQAQRGVEVYQKNKRYSVLDTTFPLQDFVSTYPYASTNDQKIIMDTTLQHLATLQAAGLKTNEYFLLARTLGNALDKAAKNSKNSSESQFSEALAECGLKSFLQLTHAKATQEGEDPAKFAFQELGAAAVQTTGAMGALFKKTYQEAKPFGKISL